VATTTNAIAGGTMSTSNAATYASASFTPVAGDLLVVFAGVSATTTAGTMTASANGITFTRVTNAVRLTSADRLYCFVANQLVPASPAAMTVTMNVTGDNGTGAGIMVARISGMTRAGLAAIRQSAVVSNVAAGVAPSTVFTNSCLTDNPTLMGVFHGTAAPAYTPTTNWTEQVDASYTVPTAGCAYQSRDSGFTGTTITAGTTTIGQNCAISVELETYASGLNPKITLAPQRQAPIRAAVI
jgi:hypothetical protein